LFNYSKLLTRIEIRYSTIRSDFNGNFPNLFIRKHSASHKSLTVHRHIGSTVWFIIHG